MDMFNRIADGYDSANQLISVGMYKKWYKYLVEFAYIEEKMKVLDCATGTGNVAIEFKKKYGSEIEVLGVDISENMLKLARDKSDKLNLDIEYIIADILNMPFDDNTFNVASITFGIRNTESYIKCLKEIARVVKPGGRVLILETGKLSGAKSAFYKIYQQLFVKPVGILLTGSKTAYDWLASSSNSFPSGDEFIALIEESESFSQSSYRSFMFGSIYLYIAIVN